MAKWTFFHTQGDLNDPGGIYTAVPGGIDQLPGIAGAGQQLVVSSLFINGVSQLPFGDISGHYQMANGTGFVGDGASDVLWMNSGDTHNAIIWDDRTTNDPGNVNPSGRYGLPGGDIGQEDISIEVIRGGDVDEAGVLNDVISDDFINLSYNTADGGRAYALDITIYGGTGRDLLVSGEGNDVLYGGNEDDNLGDGLLGMGGNDTLYGGINNTSTGADDLFGYAGDDTMFGANNGDVYYGDQGNDVIYSAQAFATDQGSGLAIGNVDTVTLFGGDGDDLMIAGRNGSAVVGNRGMEFFFGGNMVSDWVDAEYFQTSNGEDNSLNDTVSYANATAAAIVDLETANFDINNDNMQYGTGAGSAVNDRFYGIEHLIGSNFNDFLTGSFRDNRLEGGEGIDTLRGEGGSDTLIGGNGDDTIDAGADNDLVEGGVGADSLAGGTGSDTLSYSQSGAAVNVTLGGGGTGGDAQGDTVATDFENLIGSVNNDTLTGDGNANTILGLGGVDTIEGGAGDDVMGGNDRTDVDAPSDGDWLSYNSAAAPGIQASLFAGTASGSAGTDVFGGFQHLLGSNLGNDFLEGNDTENSIVGQGGNDTLSGLGGIDTVYGGGGDDTVLAGTNGGTFDTTVVGGWDGQTGSDAINVTLALGTERVSDLVFGGIGTDTMDMQQLIGDSPRTLFTSPNSNFATFLTGVEIIVAGAAADVINLTFNDGVTRTAYGEAVSIFAGAGNDIVFSGSNSDLIVGGRQSGSEEGEGSDTLYGGQGADTIFGDDFNASAFGGDDRLFGGIGTDSLYGGVGNDTVMGGTDKDLAFGGVGDDLLIDGDDAEMYGGDGSDLLLLDLADLGSSESLLYGGDNVGTDGDDSVFVTGFYAKVDSSLGAGNDKFISLAVGDDGNGNSGDRVDRVRGEDGNDVISTWFGDDEIDGGAGGDALWGGAGVDTIMGGADGDILYGGAGDGDLLIGGDGSDYYYWARTDGIDRIDDQDTVAGGEGDNYILVFSGYDGTGQMPAGSGVFETDQDLYDNAGGDDMVQLVDLDGAGAGTMYRLTILQGAGAGSSIEFDQTEISVIGLWNNDAVGSTPVVTAYVWDPIDGRYEYQA